MRGPDVGRRALKRAAQGRVESVQGAVAVLARHLELSERDPVVLERVRAQRVVAVLPHVPYGGRGACGHSLVDVARAVEEHAPQVGGKRTKVATGGEGWRAHAINLSMRVTRMPSPPTALSALIVR
jgi:hypothetical protein